MKHYILFFILSAIIILFHSCEKDEVKIEELLVLEGYIEMSIDGLSTDGHKLQEESKLQFYRKGYEDVYNGYHVEDDSVIRFSIGRVTDVTESGYFMISFMIVNNAVKDIAFDMRYQSARDGGEILVLEAENNNFGSKAITNFTFDPITGKARGDFSGLVTTTNENSEYNWLVSGTFSVTSKEIIY